MIELTRNRVDRLVFVRYLLRQAEIQKDKGRPFSSAAILLLHDLVDCFLQVALEVHLPDEKKIYNDFLDKATEKLNVKLADLGHPFISRGFIKTLNELRNQLKHSTIFIDEAQITGLFLDTTNFVNTYTKIFFDKDISEFSVADLIKNTPVKENLRKAEAALGSGDLENAIIFVGVGYLELERTELLFEDKWRGSSALRPLSTPRYNTTSHARLASIGTSRSGGPSSESRETFKEISENFTAIHLKIFDIEKAIIYGIDYLSFLRFKSYLPDIRVVSSLPFTNSKTEFLLPKAEHLKRDGKYTLEKVKFCKEFLEDIALKINA